MPELPEVETVKRYLEQHITGLKITNYCQYRSNIRHEIAKNFKELTESATIIALRRKAKYLILDLDNNYSIIVHLGMTGRFILETNNYKPLIHDHVVFVLKPKGQLVFNDTRRFGMLYCVKNNEIAHQRFLKDLGPEPLSKQFNVDYLINTLGDIKSPIKNSLMNNKIVVGIGNIYASESLFLAKINPERTSNSLTILEAENLIIAIKQILTKAIEAGGTTLKDFVNGDKKPGYFKQELACYGRENLPCKICNTNISKIRQAGRATYHCTNCQQ